MKVTNTNRGGGGTGWERERETLTEQHPNFVFRKCKVLESCSLLRILIIFKQKANDQGRPVDI